MCLAIKRLSWFVLGANCHAILSGKGQTRAVPHKIVPCQAFSLQQGKPMTAHSSFLRTKSFQIFWFFWFKGVAKINLSWWFCCWWCAKLSQYSKPLEYSPLVPLSMAKCLMAPRLAPPHGETLTCFGTLTLGSAGTRPRPVPQYSMTPKDLAMPPLVHRWRLSSCFTLLVASHSQAQSPT